MNEILQAIVDYVQSPRTDYALLITGPWGCGKTHFWKYVAAPHLQRMSTSAPYRPLYASFYGCPTTKEVGTQFFLASNPIINRLATSKHRRAHLATAAAQSASRILQRVTQFELPTIDPSLLINRENAVFCFDDLERTPLQIAEVLGYINTFVEHGGGKAIILCSEEEIRTNDDNADEYVSTREKVVGASLAFQPQLDDVFRNLIDEHDSCKGFHGYITQHANLLRKLFDRSGTGNIRSLRRTLSALAVVFHAVERLSVDPNEVAKHLVYSLAPASFELYGCGVDPSELRKVYEHEHMVLSGGLGSKEEDGEKTYPQRFVDKYFADWSLAEFGEARTCMPIFDYLVKGTLDRDALASWVTEITRRPTEMQERHRRLRSDPLSMTDVEFTESVNQTLEDIASGQVTDPALYVLFHNLFSEFTKLGLLNMTPDQLLTCFTTGLQEAQKRGPLLSTSPIQPWKDHPGIGPATPEGKTLFELLVQEEQDAEECRVRKHIQDRISKRNDNPQAFLRALCTDEEEALGCYSVFQEFSDNELREWTIALPNALKLTFYHALKSRYANPTLASEFVAELPALRGLRDGLRDYVGEGAPKHPLLSHYLIQLISGILDEAIEKLEQAAAVADDSNT